MGPPYAPCIASGPELLAHVGTLFPWRITQVCGGNVALHDRVSKSAPTCLGLATLGGLKKEAPPLFKPAHNHVLVLADKADTILGTATAYKYASSGDRLTVLYPRNEQVPNAEEGSCQPGFSGYVRLPLHLLQELGFNVVRTPPFSGRRGHLRHVYVAVHSQILASKKDSSALFHACPDSSADSSKESCRKPTWSDTAHMADLSSTCIEFVGTLHDRKVRILLDSGASANFVKSSLVDELTLPTVLLRSPVTVHQG